MSSHTQAIVITFFLAVVSAIGDSVLKLAGRETNPIVNRWFLLGLLIFSGTTFGWVFVIRHVKLAVVGGLFSVSITLFLALSGYVWFNEKLMPIEWVGLLMAVVSMFLLGRVAG